MSLHQLANHMSAQGRGPDSTLVHMSPREVSGLQSLAMAHGGTLTINPQTGLPEAGFLDSLLPTLLGGAATFFSGGAITPFMAALGVGGLTALTSKDLGKGLMAGLGAYGGAGIMEGLAGFGAADIGEKAVGAAAADAAGAGLTGDAYSAAMQKSVGDRMAGASYYDRLAAGASKAMSNPGDAFNAIGGGSKLQGAAMLGAPLLSALSSQDQTSVPTAEQIKFDPSYANINISRSQRPYQPDTGSSGERRYFGNTYVTQYADGGAVANDGIEHFAYGGGTIDPTYDYSGYGPRSNSSGMRPIAYAEAAKPDFVGADGKTYRYDPIKKSWYVIKEAETKTNPGVETLMVGSDRGGNDGGGLNDGSGGLPGYGAYQNQGALAAFLSDIGLTSAGQAAATNLGNQLNEGLTLSGADISGGQFAGNTAYGGGTGLGSGGAQGAHADNSANPLGGDVTSTPAGGIASLGSGISPADKSGGPAPEALEAETGFTSLAQGQLDREAAVDAKMATENALIDAAQKEAEDKAAAFSAALANANAAPAMQAANAATIAGFSGTGLGDGKGYGGGYGGNGGAGGSSPGGTGGGGGGFGPQAKGGMVGRYAQGGLGSLGGYSDGGRLLRGPGNGVSDDIPATIGAARQPARLADGEFVLPARIVSELGNGSTEAGARALYKMMARIQANRRKTTGKNSVAVDSKAHKYLPA